jgi:ribosomal protein L9
MATSPTPGAIVRLAERRKLVEAELKALRQTQKSLIERLTEHEITILRSANEQGVLFGGVSQHDIAETLREEGFDVEDRFIRVGEQIKRLDSYEVPIIIDRELRTTIKLWVVTDKPAEQLEPEAAQVEAQLDEGEAVASEDTSNE